MNSNGQVRKLFCLIALLTTLVSGCTVNIATPTAGVTTTALPTAVLPATTTPGRTTSATAGLTVVITLAPSLTPSLAPTLPPAVAILRGPYLQDVTPGSIWVVWDTAQLSTGWVAYGPTTDLTEGVALETQPGLHHAVQLTGLQNYTPYFYRAAGDTVVSSFRSAAAPGQAQFRFAVFGDTRANPAVHSAIIAGITAARPDLALHTGDLVDDGNNNALWDSFLKIESPLMRIAPLYPTLGNHENGAAQYFSIFHLPGSGAWYSFDYADARFIVLKADNYYPGAFAAGSEQRTWLEQQLSGASARWIFVSFHVPPHTSFAEDPSEVNLRRDLAPLFEQYKVTAVFNGHIHSYERVIANSVTYIVTGGGGAPLYSLNVKEPGQQAGDLVYHYMLIEVNGDKLTGKAIDVNGKVIDSFEIMASRP